MSKQRLLLYISITIFLSGCFKLGYQVEFGAQEKVMEKGPSSGYYYKSPMHYTK